MMKCSDDAKDAPSGAEKSWKIRYALQLAHITKCSDDEANCPTGAEINVKNVYAVFGAHQQEQR